MMELISWFVCLVKVDMCGGCYGCGEWCWRSDVLVGGICLDGIFCWCILFFGFVLFGGFDEVIGYDELLIIIVVEV